MNRLLTPKQMADAEQASVQLGVSLWELMQNAGAALARHIITCARELGAESVLILCGSGNNGGDGLVCAGILAEHGLDTSVYLLNEPKTELAKKAFGLIGKAKIVKELPFVDIMVDCLFGTGFHGQLSDEAATLLKRAEHLSHYTIACDMPSGVNCLTGQTSDGTLHYDETVTFHCTKIGMLIKPALYHCGKITVADINIPDGWEDFLDDKTYSCSMAETDIHKLMPSRPEHSHKGTFGKLLLICGCEHYIGAAAIASRAALRTGCGIVCLAAPQKVIQAIAGGAPECVYCPMPSDENGFISEAAIPELLELADNCSAVAVGCGLGLSDGTEKIVSALIKNVEKPLIIDADGINLLARNIDVLRDKNHDLILTPHFGELARLAKLNISETAARRYDICRELADKYSVTLHSKDSTTVTFADGNAYLTNFGCSALAKGGSGDMLCGVIGSMLAQGVNPAEACMLGSYIMGRTAEILSENNSPAALTASDIIAEFRRTLMVL